ncbi:MAG: flippase [Candidatus Tectomicrobia bacterium]|uniref:Flippase n=1 Tax=Tectimicrobiota bacterium TaxID=2528274 RepID=A0A932HXE1_UNCTE|nr:flippase [Candidatus Tectomicrobia bacterium]
MAADRTKARIFSNTAWLAAGTLVNALIGLYITRALARYLGVADYGLYALAFVYLNFTAVIANFGFDSILLREAARDKEGTDSIVSSGIVLKSAFAVPAVAAGALYLAGRDFPPAYTVAVIFLLLSHFVGAFDTYEIVLKARLRAQNVAAASVLSQLLLLGAVLLGRARGWPLEWLIASYVFVRLPRAAFVYLRLRREISLRWRWDPAHARFVLRESAVIGLSGLIWVFYFRVDALMLEWMKGPEAVGQYAAAYKFIELGLLGSGLVMASLAPLLAERWPANPAGFRWIYRETIDYMAMIGALGAGAMAVLAPDLIRTIYAPSFTDAISVLRILSFALITLFMNNAFGHTMVMVGVQGPGFMTTRVLGTVLNVALNLLWIPRWGAYGAAWATVASEIGVLLLSPAFVHRRTGIWPRPWTPLFGAAAVWLSWKAYLAAGGGRVEASWPARLAGCAVLAAALAAFLAAHRRQIGELLLQLRGKSLSPAGEPPIAIP